MIQSLQKELFSHEIFSSLSWKNSYEDKSGVRKEMKAMSLAAEYPSILPS